MNSLNRISPITNSNPASVLDSISAVQGHVVEQPAESASTSTGWEPPQSVEPSGGYSEVEFTRPTNQQDAVAPIKLRINPATTTQQTVDNVLESCVESAEQIQQLASHLNNDRNDLDIRESDLDSRIETWEREVQSQQEDLQLKLQELEQQSAQVRCQQLHLMQLQTDIVKSHESAKAAIESLVTVAGSDHQTISTLKALKHQVSGRFDYIARRWEHLANIMQKQRDDQTAKMVDDTVDWAGQH